MFSADTILSPKILNLRLVECTDAELTIHGLPAIACASDSWACLQLRAQEAIRDSKQKDLTLHCWVWDKWATCKDHSEAPGQPWWHKSARKQGPGSSSNKELLPAELGNGLSPEPPERGTACQTPWFEPWEIRSSRFSWAVLYLDFWPEETVIINTQWFKRERRAKGKKV